MTEQEDEYDFGFSDSEFDDDEVKSLKMSLVIIMLAVWLVWNETVTLATQVLTGLRAPVGVNFVD